MVRCISCGMKQNFFNGFGWVGPQCGQCFDLDMDIQKQKNRRKKYNFIKKDLTWFEKNILGLPNIFKNK